MSRRVGLAALLALAAVAPAAAGEPTETLRKLFERANQILASPEATDDRRVAALRRLVSEVFDAGEAAALALGRHWQARTAAERDEFRRLYADIVEMAYLGGVGARARVHEDGIHVGFESEVVDGTRATVVTTLETRGSGVVPVEYRMQRVEGGWTVVDVFVEGLSLAGSYRAQFQRILQTGTYADLVARLRARATATTLAAIAAAPVAAILPSPLAVAAPAPPPRVVTPIAPAAPESAAPAALWIQVGAFHDTEAASQLMERLRAHEVVLTFEGDRATVLARVLIGPFADRDAATSVVKDLAARGYRPFIAVE